MIAEIIRAIIYNTLDNTPSFKAIEEATAEAQNLMIYAIDKTVKDSKSKEIAQFKAMKVCRQYQFDGYLKGIHEGIRLANILNNNQVQVQDMDTGEKIK